MSLAPPPPRGSSWPTGAVLYSVAVSVVAVALAAWGFTRDTTADTDTIVADGPPLTEIAARCDEAPSSTLCMCVFESLTRDMDAETAGAGLERPLYEALGDVAFLAAVEECGRPATDAAATPADPGDVPAAAAGQCRNEVHGFTVSAPDGWEIGDGSTPTEVCRFVNRIDSFGSPTIIVEGVTAFTFQEMYTAATTSTDFEEAIWSEQFTTTGGHPAYAAILETSGGSLEGTQTLHVVTDTPIPVWFFVQIQPDYLAEVDLYNDVMLELAGSLIVE